MKKSKKSLRSILTLWFLTFSIVPLAFVSGYSIVLYETSLNNELQKRLEGNTRVVGVDLSKLESYLLNYGKVHATDPTLVYHVATRNIPSARRVVTDWMKSYSVSKTVLFDREGRLIVAQMRGADNQIKAQQNLETGDVYLTEKLLEQVNVKGQISVREVVPGRGLELIVYTKIIQKGNRTAGYLEEVIELGQGFVNDLKERLNLEAVIFDNTNMPAAASNQDLMLYPKEFFPEKIGTNAATFFDITSRGEPFGMMVRKFVDSKGQPYLTLGLAGSKKDTQKVIGRIKGALLTITLIIFLLLIPTLIYVSNSVVKPINALVEVTEKMEKGDLSVQLKVKVDTEIGILIESFNKMSKNLFNTQSTLVHSAKMASLGQLVAGVAHELNNPIGFIYSNMSHLREYAEKLKKVLDAAEESPAALKKAKQAVDFDYIIEDLPKLIASCEDGARRTRDIVMGLRNFSRLDEAQLKRVDLHEGLRNTLKLLSGELKNRIKVHEDYGRLAEVRCYVSQLNQVFMNIISNAAQAINKDGEIWITTWSEEQWACISIRDSGPGIPKQVQDRIFDPFFTTKPVGQGTGLGLSISYGIIKKHGGDIDVKSEIGKGTEFIIRVPVDGPADDPKVKSS